jgi:hypothetical protein
MKQQDKVLLSVEYHQVQVIFDIFFMVARPCCIIIRLMFKLHLIKSIIINSYV